MAHLAPSKIFPPSFIDNNHRMSSPYQTPQYTPSSIDPPRNDGRRPLGATVFGILCVLFASLTCIGLVLGTIAIGAAIYFGFEPFDQTDMFPLGIGYSVFGTVLSVVLATLQLAAGIGLLKVTRWGLRLSFTYSMLTILSTIGNTIYFYVFSLPPALAHGEDAGIEQIEYVPGLAGVVTGMCFSLIFPVALLIYVTRKKTKQLFSIHANSAV